MPGVSAIAKPGAAGLRPAGSLPALFPVVSPLLSVTVMVEVWEKGNMTAGGPALLAGAATVLDGLVMGTDVMKDSPAASDGSTAVQGTEPAVVIETTLVSPDCMLLCLLYTSPSPRDS